MKRQTIFLIGFMGTGKSTVARGLSKKSGMAQMEMDAEIVRRQGMSINDIFEKYGEDYFRDLETGLLIQLKDQEGMVVSCGGGAVLRRENVEHMRACGRVILLTASAKTIYHRVKNSKDRPILNRNMSEEYISGLMEKRREAYEAAADFIVDTDGRTVRQICEEISGYMERQELD